MAIINDRIKSMRNQRGHTLVEVANKVGVKEATMQRYESGQIKNIPYKRIVDIAKALNTTPAYLMGWENDAGETDLALTAIEIGKENNINPTTVYDTIVKMDACEIDKDAIIAAVKNETKKSPIPMHADEEHTKYVFGLLYDFLVDAGYVREGDNLTETQVMGLTAALRTIEIFFADDMGRAAEM